MTESAPPCVRVLIVEEQGHGCFWTFQYAEKEHHSIPEDKYLILDFGVFFINYTCGR